MSVYFDTNWHCRWQPNDKEEVKGHGNLFFIVSFGWTGGSYSTSLACQQPSGQTTQNMKIKQSFLWSCSNSSLKHLIYRVKSNSRSRVPSEMISCSIKTKAKWKANMFFLLKKKILTNNIFLQANARFLTTIVGAETILHALNCIRNLLSK